MSSERERASRRASRDFVQQEMDNLKQFKRLSIGQHASIQDPDLPSASSYREAAPFEKKDDTLWVPASVHPEVSPNEWKSFVKTRIKRDSTGSRLSQIISVEGDLKDGTAVLERKRQSQDLTSRRQSIIDMVTAYESKQPADRPVVKAPGVELRRSGASSRRERPVLRKHEEVERRASEASRRERARPLERNKSLPTRYDENQAQEPRPRRRADLRIEIPEGERPDKSWHLESHTKPEPKRLGHQRSLPALPRGVGTGRLAGAASAGSAGSTPASAGSTPASAASAPASTPLDASASPAPASPASASPASADSPKGFWRWRKEPGTSPTSKTFTSLFKRKKEKPPTPSEETPAPGFEQTPPSEIPIESSIPPVPPTPELPESPKETPPKKSSHQRSKSQIVSRHEVDELRGSAGGGEAAAAAATGTSEPAAGASAAGAAASPRAEAEESDRVAKGEMQLPYVIPAHQISDRSYVMMYHRFPLHIERAIYRFSHMKLANPRRPLREQVLLSNFMYAYLNLINQGYQQQMEQQAIGEVPEVPEAEAAAAAAAAAEAEAEPEAEPEAAPEAEPGDSRVGRPKITPRKSSRKYGYQDYDFEFYQSDSSSSSSSDSEAEVWEGPR